MNQYQIEDRGSEYIVRTGVVVDIPGMGTFRAVTADHKLASKTPLLEPVDSLHGSKITGPGMWHDTLESAIQAEQSAIVARHARQLEKLKAVIQ